MSQREKIKRKREGKRDGKKESAPIMMTEIGD